MTSEIDPEATFFNGRFSRHREREKGVSPSQFMTQPVLKPKGDIGRRPPVR
jgi:hypothetical protein